VSITKVVVLITRNPTKFVLHFSEFPTILYAFYKSLQKEYTIEDAFLRLGPWKEIGTRNWVPRPWEAAAPAKFRRAGRTPGRGSGGARPHAHLGPEGGRSWGGGAAGEGARRWPAAAAAAAQGSGEDGAWLDNARPWEEHWGLGERVGRLDESESYHSGELPGGGNSATGSDGGARRGDGALFK
jgi:hypothetical protein